MRFGFLERHGFVTSLSGSTSKVPGHEISRFVPVPVLLFLAKYLFHAATVAAPAVGGQKMSNGTSLVLNLHRTWLQSPWRKGPCPAGHRARSPLATLPV